MTERLQAFIASPRVVLLTLGIAVSLNLPSVGTGWHIDDLYHRAQFLAIGPLLDSSDMTNRMFAFLSGDAEEILEFKELGVLPWWADDHLKISFWRPLSSFTHVIDYVLWPDSAALMHLHSIFWLAALVVVTTLWYRRMMPIPFVAGLAAILYALDDAHGLPVGFLANRNALIATAFGVVCLWSHDRWRRDGWLAGAFTSPLAFAAALLSGESGTGASAYLFAYACFVEARPGWRRWAAIAPHAVVGLVWLVAYESMGFGTAGSGFYLDPLGQPAEWMAAFALRAPLLLLGQWFVPPSSFAFLWNDAQGVAIASFGVAVLALVFYGLRPILLAEPVARFFALGMLIAVVPITAGFPHDRLLFFVGLGAMGLLAMLLSRLFERDNASVLGRSAGAVLVVVHMVLAPPLQLLMTTAMASQEPLYAAAPRSLPEDDRLATQRLVIVNQPSFFYGQYVLLVRLLEDRTAPASLFMMAPGTSALTLERVSENAVLVEAEDGYMNAPFDNIYRARSSPFPEGYRVELTDVRIDVESLGSNGLPRRVLFTFRVPLEHPSLRWVRFDRGRYVPLAPPRLGDVVSLQPVELNLLSPPDYSNR